jgi:predicted tellurium resistance membrane protein TerC
LTPTALHDFSIIAIITRTGSIYVASVILKNPELSLRIDAKLFLIIGEKNMYSIKNKTDPGKIVGTIIA